MVGRGQSGSKSRATLTAIQSVRVNHLPRSLSAERRKSILVHPESTSSLGLDWQEGRRQLLLIYIPYRFPSIFFRITMSNFFTAPKPAGILLPAGYAYVLSSLVGATWMTFLMGAKVSGYRKAAQIPYPYQYAEKAEAEKNPKAHVFK